MSYKTHDEFGYSTDGFYSDEERFFYLAPSLYNTIPNMYMISTWGRIKNTITNTIVPRSIIPEDNVNRYRLVQLHTVDNNTIAIPIHRIVGQMFILAKPAGDVRTIVINHKDGIKWHNEVYNLEWVTQSQNAQHAIDNNLSPRSNAEDNGWSQLTNDQYREICRLTSLGYLPYQINNTMNLGIDITNIAQKIRSGKSELSISKEYDFSNIPRNDYRKFDEKSVRFICQKLQDFPGIDYDNILVELGYDTKNMDPKYRKKLKNTISTIKRRVSYIDIGNEYNF